MLFDRKGNITMAKPAKFNGLIEAHINTKIGTIVTPAEIIDAVKCTAPTAYAFIKTNPSRFEKISAGKYRVLSAEITNNFIAEAN
jgi:hypothetical protein